MLSRGPSSRRHLSAVSLLADVHASAHWTKALVCLACEARVGDLLDVVGTVLMHEWENEAVGVDESTRPCWRRTVVAFMRVMGVAGCWRANSVQRDGPQGRRDVQIGWS